MGGGGGGGNALNDAVIQAIKTLGREFLFSFLCSIAVLVSLVEISYSICKFFNTKTTLCLQHKATLELTLK